MNLLDRYLQAIKKHLPWQRQDDILAELRANLESQLEDREYELGRALTTEEVQAWLKSMGSPMQVAARYQPQQYLIGPTLFPIYGFVMRMALAWIASLYTVINALQIALGTPTTHAIVEAVLRAPVVLVSAAAWITLIFAAVEFAMAHYPAQVQSIIAPYLDWNPAALPPIEPDTAPGKKRRSLAHALAEVVFGFIGLIWLLLIPHNPWVVLGPGALYLESLPYELTPVWFLFYWSIVALNLIQLIWRSIDLARGSWQRPHPLQGIVWKTMGIVPPILLLTAAGHTFVVLKQGVLPPSAQTLATLDTINLSIYRGMMVVCAITVLQLLWDIAQFALRAYRK